MPCQPVCWIEPLANSVDRIGSPQDSAWQLKCGVAYVAVADQITLPAHVDHSFVRGLQAKNSRKKVGRWIMVSTQPLHHSKSCKVPQSLKCPNMSQVQTTQPRVVKKVAGHNEPLGFDGIEELTELLCAT